MISGGPHSRGRPRGTSIRKAVAFDVTAETMMKYYTATEKKQTAYEVRSACQVFGRAAGLSA
jgi:hypothetical protein